MQGFYHAMTIIFKTETAATKIVKLSSAGPALEAPWPAPTPALKSAETGTICTNMGAMTATCTTGTGVTSTASLKQAITAILGFLSTATLDTGRSYKILQFQTMGIISMFIGTLQSSLKTILS